MSNFLAVPPVGWERGRVLEWLNGEHLHTLNPSGMISPYGGTAAPSGWLLCDGSAVSRTTYARLFAVLSTTYGAGDGSTTFNLPDLRQRFPIGKAVSGTGSTLGEASGNVDHDHTTPDHTLTITEIPAHAHVQAFDGDWTTTLNGTNVDKTVISSDPTGGSVLNTGSTGGGAAHNHGSTSPNNPPYLAVNYIVKT